jgi:hypothetical protein
MSLESFIENCDGGGFIDDDGSEIIWKTVWLVISVFTHLIRVVLIRKDFDSIIWF